MTSRRDVHLANGLMRLGRTGTISFNEGIGKRDQKHTIKYNNYWVQQYATVEVATYSKTLAETD